jgi:hypothetical protein
VTAAALLIAASSAVARVIPYTGHKEYTEIVEGKAKVVLHRRPQSEYVITYDRRPSPFLGGRLSPYVIDRISFENHAFSVRMQSMKKLFIVWNPTCFKYALALKMSSFQRAQHRMDSDSNMPMNLSHIFKLV